MSTLTTFSHLQSCAEAAKQFAASLSSEVATAISEALTEMDGTKADKSASVAVTITTDGWAAGTVTDYPYTYTITADGVTTADRANVAIAPSSMSVAQAAELCPTTETGTNEIYIHAVNIPSGDMSVEYSIEYGG